MPKYKEADINYIVRAEDFEKMYRFCRDLKERNLLFILYSTGARPSEILEMKREDVEIHDDRVIFHIITKKVRKKGMEKKFIIDKRHLVLKLPREHPYIKNLERFVSKFEEGQRLFRMTRRTMHNIISRISRDALGISLCPYNFRHSFFTRFIESGGRIEEAQYLKGARDMRSVMPYLHARKVEYDIDV